MVNSVNVLLQRGGGQISNFILKCHCTDDFSRQMARYFPRRLKSSVRGRLKICPAPLQRQVFIEEVALYLNILQKNIHQI